MLDRTRCFCISFARLVFALVIYGVGLLGVACQRNRTGKFRAGPL